MKTLLILGVLAAIVVRVARWWQLEDERLSQRWRVSNGMYDGVLHDPDDPSRLQRLRAIARAQHGGDDPFVH